MSRSKKNALRLLRVGASVLALSGIPAFAADEEPSDASEQGSAGQVLLGAIDSIDGEYYLIRIEDGGIVKYHVSKETRLNGSDFKPGDRVIGSVTPEGHVLVLTKRFSTKVGA